jgi:hypothetical protein
MPKFDVDDSLVSRMANASPEVQLDILRQAVPFDVLYKAYGMLQATLPAGATKHDANKPRVGLMVGGFSRALTAVAEVATFGASKYSDNGWKDMPNGHARCTDAMLRHLLAEQCGETKDPESGIHHAAHAAWNALARLEYELRGKK